MSASLLQKSNGDPTYEGYGAVPTSNSNDVDISPSSRKTWTVKVLWGFLTFGWFTPVLERMRDQLSRNISPDLDDEKIPQLHANDSSAALMAIFKRIWQEEKSKRPVPSLTWCLWKALCPLFLQAGLLKAAHDCLQFVGPQVLHGLIEFIRTPSDNLKRGFVLTAVVTVSQLSMSLCLRHYFFMCYRVSLRVRTIVLLAIYEKSLTIDSSYYQNHPIGQVTNLMSVDTQRLQDVISYLHALWYSFLQITLSMYFLWQELGPSCLAGVLVIVLSIPSTAAAANWMGGLQKKLMVRKDDRVQANQETIGNIKVVKLQSWEEPFRDKINEMRRLEIRQLFIYTVGKASTWLLWSGVPLMIALATFGAYVTIAGQTLDVASALTALSLFDILRFPLYMLPQVINQLVEAGVAMRRIENFLNAPNQQPIETLEDPTKLVVIKDAAFTYHNLNEVETSNPSLELKFERTEKELVLMKALLADAEEQLAKLEGRETRRVHSSTSLSTLEDDLKEDPRKVLSLRQVNFECRPGEFIVVVGRVGSGKSTFLRSMLGEVSKAKGDVQVRGKMSYFDQKAFIMNETIKNNILFGNPDNDTELYELALEASCLKHDLSLLSHGDQTEIGERGVTLSGGQKARISMARAVYHRADISLLDDCLSAVDAHVGRDLFEQCIVKALLGRGSSDGNRREKSVILVTNALNFLSHPMVDRILVLEQGVIAESGSYKDLTSRSDSKLQRLLSAFKDSMAGEYSDSAPGLETEDQAATEVDDEQWESSPPRRSSAVKHNLRRSSASNKRPSSTEIESIANDEIKHKSLMTDEMAERGIGKVGLEVYKTWMNAAGGFYVVPLLFLVFTIGEAISILSNWWLTYWSHHAESTKSSQLYFLGIYGIINVSTVFALFVRQVIVAAFSIQASKILFSKLLDSTLLAPMSFFDTTPAGRIMNRFSKDVYTVDEALPDSFQMYVECLFNTVSTLVVVTSVTPVFASALIPMIYYYRQQQKYFTQCYRELKRIDSVTRSPIHGLFGETLDGPATVRAFGAQKSLYNRMASLVDTQQHAFYLLQTGLCWLAIRLEFIGSLIITFSCLAAVFEKRNFLDGDPVFAGLAGLAISYSLSVTQTLNWGVRVGSDFEANMVSVERIRQYCNLEAEAPREMEADKNLEKNWPAGGRVEFRGTRLRYRKGLPLVLKDLNLKIPAKSKVGIVGRTGAGKSTLMAALMRLVEIDGGEITLGGIETRKVGLRRLRSSIAVIPQDPVLFSGTVRNNLDPFNQHPDERLVDVLQRVGLWITEQFSCIRDLDDAVQEGGANYSVGQRQLLVIARALLDGAGLVICDEATAAIDAEADARIQRVLRTDFSNATTLTVAHRLNTIMDSTHILVMADGRCVEFDTPANLLSHGGLFKDLVDKWEEEH